MANLGDRRKLALAQHRAVTRKISRIKANNGTQISKTEHDPRASPAFIKKATPTQLAALIRRQDKFLDRSTQFVPDSNSKPLPIKDWQTFKQAEAKHNQFIKDFYAQYKDIYITPAGQTVDSRMRAITPLHAHMGQRTTDSPYKERNKSSRSIHGEAGLKALIKDLKNRSTWSHEAKALKNHRDGVMKMLITSGDLKAQEDLAKLTKKQWALLWKYTPFGRHVKVPYDHYKDALAGRRSVTSSQMVENDLAAAKEYIKWAGNVKSISGRL